MKLKFFSFILAPGVFKSSLVNGLMISCEPVFLARFTKWGWSSLGGLIE